MDQSGCDDGDGVRIRRDPTSVVSLFSTGEGHLDAIRKPCAGIWIMFGVICWYRTWWA
jgi:hypothetical protein